MNPTVLALAAAIIGFILGAAVIYLAKARQRSQELKSQFGHEYERMLSETGNRVRAESLLEERRARVHRLSLRHLSAEERASFEKGWNAVQARFVDDPSGAITEADQLVNKVIHAVGYPDSDFEQQAGDISVDHPESVEQYRAAHFIATRNQQDGVNTEQLRVALLHYKTILGELLGGAAWTASGRNRI